MKANRSLFSKVGYGIGSAVRDFRVGMSTGRWEGSEHTRNRMRGPRALESVDWGVNYGVREGMLSEARNLEQTFAIAKRIVRQYANHCVGSCLMKWHTDDIEWNRSARKAWRSWMGGCDVQRRHVFKKMTKISIQRTIADGRVFTQLDRRGKYLGLLGIEGDRVSSDGIFNADRAGLVSGIGLDGNGAAAYYKVWERSLFGTFLNPQEIPASQMVHVFDTGRFDSVSGVTAFDTVLNPIRDLKETRESERLAAKRMSKWALLVKKLTGGAVGIENLVFNGGGTGTTGNSQVDNSVGVQNINSVADAFMFPGESAEAVENPRPSEGWRWLMEDLIREISIGLDLPFGVVWNMAGLGGPAVRFEINQANRTFMAFLQDVIDPMWFRPIVAAWITLEMDEGRLPFHPEWYKFKTPRPKSITIDLGRDSKAGIQENAAGLRTATDWYAEEDMDFEDQIDTLVYEAKYREAARLGVPIASIKEVPLEQIRALGAVSTALAGDAGESEEDEPGGPTTGNKTKQKNQLANR